MKKMTLFLILFTLVFTSCNNDDDSPPAQDPFIGTWTYYKTFVNDVEEVLSDCEQQNMLQVNVNGSIISTGYDDFSGPCELDSSETGTWENLGNGSYSIIFDGEPSTEELTFESNTFYYIEVDGAFTYKDVFIKN